MTVSTKEKAKRFEELHASGCFVMANAWDAGSARVLEAAGFPGLGTTSAGFAWAAAQKDAAASRDLLLANAKVNQWRTIPFEEGRKRQQQKKGGDVFPMNEKYYLERTQFKKALNGQCGDALGRYYHSASLQKDFYHYVANLKPWLDPIHASDIPTSLPEKKSSQQVWLYWLGMANRTWDLHLPSTLSLEGIERAPLPYDSKDDSLFTDASLELPIPMYE